MKLIAPETTTTDQKRFYFSPFVIKYITVPIGMISLAHVRIFIRVGAVEHIKTVCVIGKMRGYPVQQYTDFCFMKCVYQFHKRLRISKTGSRRKISYALVTPAAVIGKFH